MAAAEARAAWQRAANRCFVQEDAKRAPKLATSCQTTPTTSPQHHDHPNPANPEESQQHHHTHIPSLMPLNWNPLNSHLPQDTKWWLQLQPCVVGYQRDLLCDESERKSDQPLLGEIINVDPAKREDVFEPPWMVSTAFLKQCPDTGFDRDLKMLTDYSKESVKCRGHVGKDQNQHERDMFSFDPLVSKSEKGSCNSKPLPWWRVAHEEELALLVAERAIQHIENCDLPRPAQTVHVHTKPSAVGKIKTPLVFCDPASDEKNRYSGWPPQEDYPFSGSQQQTRNIATSNCKNTEGASNRAQLLEALRHSQTRAREAEEAAKKAYEEKDHVVKLLFRQASHLFAHKQWLKMLQLENICLQLRIKEHQIASLLPDLPWMVEDKEEDEGDDAVKRNEKKQGFCNAVMFAFGLGLAGVGLMLGWTLGWLLPKKKQV